MLMQKTKTVALHQYPLKAVINSFVSCNFELNIL